MPLSLTQIVLLKTLCLLVPNRDVVLSRFFIITIIISPFSTSLRVYLDAFLMTPLSYTLLATLTVSQYHDMRQITYEVKQKKNMDIPRVSVAILSSCFVPFVFNLFLLPLLKMKEIQSKLFKFNVIDVYLQSSPMDIIF